MGRHHSAAEKAAAVQRVTNGEKVAAVARDLGVDGSSVRGWLKRAGSGPPPAVAGPTLAPASASTGDATFAGAPAGPSADAFATALDSAFGGGGGSSNVGPAGAPETPNGGAPPRSSPPPPPSAGLPPPPSPEALVQMLESVKLVTVKVIAGTKRVKLSRSDLQTLATFDGTTREQMIALAPYAAEYVPQVAEYVKPLMAGLFAVVFGLSVAESVKELELRAKAQRAAERSSVDANPANETSSRTINVPVAYGSA